MSVPGQRDHPPAGITPVAVPGETVLLRLPGLVISAGGFRAWPQGFEFTLLTLGDVSAADSAWLAGTEPARTVALHLQERGRDPQVRLLDEESSETGEKMRSRWWVTPLPPPGPVQLVVRLSRNSDISGTGCVDGQVIAEAGTLAGV